MIGHHPSRICAAVAVLAGLLVVPIVSAECDVRCEAAAVVIQAASAVTSPTAPTCHMQRKCAHCSFGVTSLCDRVGACRVPVVNGLPQEIKTLNKSGEPLQTASLAILSLAPTNTTRLSESFRVDQEMTRPPLAELRLDAVTSLRI